MPVHSARLATTIALGTSLTTLYTVPTGKRTIIKSVVAQNFTASTPTLTMGIYSGSTEIGQWSIHMASLGTVGDTQIVPVWIVMNAGELLKAFSSAASIGVVVSGTELIE
jgi:hypothetical protein